MGSSKACSEVILKSFYVKLRKISKIVFSPSHCMVLCVWRTSKWCDSPVRANLQINFSLIKLFLIISVGFCKKITNYDRFICVCRSCVVVFGEIFDIFALLLLAWFGGDCNNINLKKCGVIWTNFMVKWWW